jgi:uncharacterized protein (TIGR02466 family)
VRTDYFATPVYKFDIVYDNDKLENWIRGINKNVSKNIHGGFQSFEKETMEYQLPYNFADLESMLQEKINVVANDLDIGDCRLQNYWGNVNPQGSCNDTHNHPNALLVANYYVSAPSSDMGDLIVHRDDEAQYYVSQIARRNNITERQINITPYTGLFVVFPGWVKHSVNTNLNSKDRISISLNYGRIKNEN